MNTQNPTSIFIIDDDKMLASALKKDLETNFADRNLNIKTFMAGEEAKSYINEKPDLAIVDYHLNSKYKDAMNGVKTIDIIKKNSPDTEVIMFTGEDHADIATKAMQHGAHDYVVKNEMMFRKLKMSVYQCLKLKELKKEIKLQKVKERVLFIAIALMLGATIALEIWAPHIFRN